MFFCLRIMILRTNKHLLFELFTLIWPVLYYLMVTILNDENGISDINLKLATLKLIELLCLIEYEGFYLHFWNLGIDSSEITFYELSENQEDIKSFVSEYPYISFICKLIQKNFGFEYINFKQNIDDDYFKKKKNKREIIIQVNNVANTEELSDIAFKFVEYTALNNAIKLETDWDLINKVIVDDFVALNNFST